jgi:putative transposase
MSVDRRRQTVQTDHASLSIVRQCALLSISRSGYYYDPLKEDAESLEVMRAIDKAYLKFPFRRYYSAARNRRLSGRPGQGHRPWPAIRL